LKTKKVNFFETQCIYVDIGVFI